MRPVRPFVIVSWILLPTVMFGGFSLLNLIAQGGKLTPFQEQFFRAGHAHAGVLLIMSLAYYYFLGQTSVPNGQKVMACAALLVGVLAQSGGFFLHMGIGQPSQLSAGNYLSMTGAAILGLAVIFLLYALIRFWKPAT
jgi:hypothetical protein